VYWSRRPPSLIALVLLAGCVDLTPPPPPVTPGDGGLDVAGDGGVERAGLDAPADESASPSIDAPPPITADAPPPDMSDTAADMATCVPGAICGPVSCSGSTEQTASTCDGAGACVPGYLRDCGAYLCNGNGCGTACGSSAQCAAGYVCTGGACVTGTPVDAAAGVDRPAGELLLDDFSDADLTTNNLGAAVSWDNATATVVAGQQQLVWNGMSTFQDLDEALRPGRCEYDAARFSKLVFQLRTSTASKRLAVLLAVGDGACKQAGLIRQTTITTSTTMTTYQVDISRTAHDKLLFIRFAPTILDDTAYFLDDIRLAP
jgi:hypothetical protein